MRLSLALGLVPGLGTGLLLVLVAGAGLPVSIAWPQLAQAHGQVQALGYTLLFILAVGLQLFPRFLGAPLLHGQRAPWGASLVALSLVARLVGQPLAPGTGRVIVLVFSTLALPVGMLMAGSVFHGLSRRSVQPDSGPSAAWRRFVVVGGLALGTALVVYVWAGLGLAAGGLSCHKELMRRSSTSSWRASQPALFWAWAPASSDVSCFCVRYRNWRRGCHD